MRDWLGALLGADHRDRTRVEVHVYEDAPSVLMR